MSEKDEIYSPYMTLYSNNITIFALFSGFIFAAIVMVLAQYPNVAQIHVQAALFMLNFVLDLFLYVLLSEQHILGKCVEVAPTLLPRDIGTLRYWNIVLSSSWILLTMVVPILFFLWSLLYLALASAIMSALLIVICYYDTVKPYNDFRREHLLVRK
jgi:hypothetical protein